MAGLPPLPELKHLIGQVMLEKDPAMHRQLSQSGNLDKVLTERAKQAQDSFATAKSKVSEDALKASRGLSDQEAISEMMQGTNEAARTALDQAVEFAPTTTEPTSERNLEA